MVAMVRLEEVSCPMPDAAKFAAALRSFHGPVSPSVAFFILLASEFAFQAPFYNRLASISRLATARPLGQLVLRLASHCLENEREG